MGIFKGEKKFECSQSVEDGSVQCESFRENKDGTRVPLASLKMSVDGMCNVVPENMIEHVEGELQELEKKVAGRMVAKCKKGSGKATARPEDY